MSTPDQGTLLRAVEDARQILGEYIEPGQRDAMRTVQRLLTRNSRLRLKNAGARRPRAPDFLI
jgi:hypothetical protein